MKNLDQVIDEFNTQTSHQILNSFQTTLNNIETAVDLDQSFKYNMKMMFSQLEASSNCFDNYFAVTNQKLNTIHDQILDFTLAKRLEKRIWQTEDSSFVREERKVKVGINVSLMTAKPEEEKLDKPIVATSFTWQVDQTEPISAPVQPTQETVDVPGPLSAPEILHVQRAVVLYDYSSTGENQISLSAGDEIIVVNLDTPGWALVTNCYDETGYFPANYIRLE